jgi:hypothetical protein
MDITFRLSAESLATLRPASRAACKASLNIRFTQRVSSDRPAPRAAAGQESQVAGAAQPPGVR